VRPVNVTDFNSAPADELRPVLTDCLAVPRWVDEVLTPRPYADRAALLAHAGIAARTLNRDEIQTAIAAHPRIGERKAGEDTAAKWSRTEQSGVDESLADRLRDANRRYEDRFGHIYLVCATGRSGSDLLADLEERMANDPAAELTVVGRELAKIAALRLAKAVSA
jgi:2-oxo-4-hydroxy-4-carboxy-5-ureidoimidazoline decarboxylase